MQTFKLNPETFKKAMLARLIPTIVFTLAVATLVAAYNWNPDLGITDISNWAILVVMALVLTFGIIRSVRREKAIFESYTSTISEHSIVREAKQVPDISINFDEVKEIVKHKSGAFHVQGKNAADLITIPRQVNNPEALEQTLQAIQPIIASDKLPFFQKYRRLPGFAILGLMLCVYVVQNKIVVGIAGTILVPVLIWSFIKVRGNKNVPYRTKRSVLWLLVVLASIVAIMYIKLIGLN